MSVRVGYTFGAPYAQTIPTMEGSTQKLVDMFAGGAGPIQPLR